MNKRIKYFMIWGSFTVKNALWWRINVWGVGKDCPVCGERFNRRHVVECKMLKGVEEVDVKMDKFKVAYIMEGWEGEGTYCVLDWLLNSGKYKAFMAGIRRMEVLFDELAEKRNEMRYQRRLWLHRTRGARLAGLWQGQWQPPKTSKYFMIKWPSYDYLYSISTHSRGTTATSRDVKLWTCAL